MVDRLEEHAGSGDVEAFLKEYPSLPRTSKHEILELTWNRFTRLPSHHRTSEELKCAWRESVAEREGKMPYEVAVLSATATTVAEAEWAKSHGKDDSEKRELFHEYLQQAHHLKRLLRGDFVTED